jgi:hypothetical protein
MKADNKEMLEQIYHDSETERQEIEKKHETSKTYMEQAQLNSKADL